MLAGQIRDTITKAPGWRPNPSHLRQTQAKRKEVNDKTSKRRRAMVKDIRVGDQVIIKDRKPGWKFRTPYEVWTVTGVSGTMVTAEKGSDRVTQRFHGLKRELLWNTPGVRRQRINSQTGWPLRVLNMIVRMSCKQRLDQSA
ncbi:hypothetical protein NDU88_002549 [Pleurodeles waltl]|uniref:Uncharacterized protein n=1 Tax=Pleurodeles waltl TaxID=8319 RepID=A0AAV7KSF6_PLEWA|nr:hypothetical protein NDU88_002549 [Pleurodeles waltl]